jgi:hypothetical protein
MVADCERESRRRRAVQSAAIALPVSIALNGWHLSRPWRRHQTDLVSTVIIPIAFDRTMAATSQP